MRDILKRRASNNRWSLRHRSQHTAINKKWRAKNREHVRKCNRTAREKLAESVRALKNKPCLVCGRRYHYSVMDFDHVRGRKLFTIGKAVNQHVALIKIKKEIKKCDLICANCHRVRTWERRTGRKVCRQRK